jgi:hypothetical protein
MGSRFVRGSWRLDNQLDLWKIDVDRGVGSKVCFVVGLDLQVWVGQVQERVIQARPKSGRFVLVVRVKGLRRVGFGS